jgi:hypothetical protein
MMSNKDKLKNFIDLCVWAYVMHQYKKELFEGKESDLKLFENVSPQFFMDINKTLHHYFILQICSLTDRDKSFGKENLTINNLLKTIDWPNEVRKKLEAKVEQLMKFRDKIEPARSKLIAHFDLEAHVNDKALGAFEEGEDEEFFLILEEAVNIMHEHFIGGPYPIRVNNAFEPVGKFLRKLRTTEQ